MTQRDDLSQRIAEYAAALRRPYPNVRYSLQWSALLGGLVDANWKRKRPIGDDQQKLLWDLQVWLGDAEFVSRGRDADNIESERPNNFRELLEDCESRRRSAIPQAEMLAVCGLLTAAQTRFILHVFLVEGAEQSITDNFGRLLFSVNEDQHQRYQTSVAELEKLNNLGDPSIREHAFLALLKPDQLELWQSFLKQPVPIESPPDLQLLGSDAARRIKLERLSTYFRALKERPTEIGLSTQQQQLIDRLEEILKQALVWRKFALESISHSLIDHATEVVSFGLLSEAQAARTKEVVKALERWPVRREEPNHHPLSVEAAADTVDLYRGCVVDLDGRPLAGASIYLSPRCRHHFHGERLGPLRAVTDDSGKFEFRASDMTRRDLDGFVGRLSGVLIATLANYAPDYTYTEGHWDYRDARAQYCPPRVGPYRLRLTLADVPICGQLFAPDGRPLANAKVRVGFVLIPQNRDLEQYIEEVTTNVGGAMWPSRDDEYMLPNYVPGPTQETRTDQEGRFLVTGYGRDWAIELVVTASSIRTDQLRVVTHELDTISINSEATWSLADRFLHGAKFVCQMLEGLTACGIVRDRDTGQPIQGMWVTKYGHPIIHAGYNIDPAVTDELGRFEVTGLSKELLEREPAARGLTAYPQPGMPWLPASALFDASTNLVIETSRAIEVTFRIADEAGQPIDGEVVFYSLASFEPHRALMDSLQLSNASLDSYGKRIAPGVYQLAAIPGPGFVGLTRDCFSKYSSAHVDANAFFNPGSSDWVDPQPRTSFGSGNLICAPRGVAFDKSNYAAIAFLNPELNSQPIELAAIARIDAPREVTLLDEAGQPVDGAEIFWWTENANAKQAKLLNATFQLNDLNPQLTHYLRARHDERKLIGFVVLSSDVVKPISLTMVPWGEITGRIVALDGTKYEYEKLRVHNDDQQGSPCNFAWAREQGEFHVVGLMPGQSYRASGVDQDSHRRTAPIFGSQVLASGEVRHLGELRIPPPLEPPQESAAIQDNQTDAYILQKQQLANQQLAILQLSHATATILSIAIGEGIGPGILVELHVSSGDSVAKDQRLAKIEHEKAIFDFRSPTAGKILKLFIAAGQTVHHQQPFAIIEEE